MYILKPKNNHWKKHQTAMVGISPANPNWTEEKARNLADFAFNNFDDVILCVSDSLYRHTISSSQKISLEDAGIIARKMGLQWLDRFGSIFLKSQKCALFRWDEWMTYSEFQDYHMRVSDAYLYDGGFKAAVDHDIQKFQQRKLDSAGYVSTTSCRDYLLEEVAGLSVLYDHFKACEVYAGRQLECVSYVRSGNLASMAGTGITKSDFTSVYLHHIAEPTLLAA